MPESTVTHPGLAGIVVETSAISHVDVPGGPLLYRGYPAHELASTLSVEETAYLLWHGELATEDELSEFVALERALRYVDDELIELVSGLPTGTQPLEVLRTAVSVMSAYDVQPELVDRDADLARSIRLWAQVPSLVAWDWRRRRGLDPVEPHDELDYVDNFLYQTFGDVPGQDVIDALRSCMILCAEHSFTPSSFTARLTASATADLYAAVTGAISAFYPSTHDAADQSTVASGSKAATEFALPSIRSTIRQCRISLGIDEADFEPFLVASRVVGWTAHIMEQSTSDTLLRPLSRYTGPAERHVEANQDTVG